MFAEKEIIRLCKANDKKAQEILFKKYSPVLLSICLRYLNNRAKAEDVMQDAFITIFTKINQFKEKGSFEGWMKKITLNTALMQLRKNKKEIISESIEKYDQATEKDEYSIDVSKHDTKSIIESAQFSQNEIFDIVRELPLGFRTVFNLYVIEGYKHREIAKELNISIGTSKSQLLRARKKVKKLLYKKATTKLKQR